MLNLTNALIAEWEHDKASGLKIRCTNINHVSVESNRHDILMIVSENDLCGQPEFMILQQFVFNQIITD